MYEGRGVERGRERAWEERKKQKKEGGWRDEKERITGKRRVRKKGQNTKGEKEEKQSGKDERK